MRVSVNCIHRIGSRYSLFSKCRIHEKSFFGIPLGKANCKEEFGDDCLDRESCPRPKCPPSPSKVSQKEHNNVQ